MLRRNFLTGCLLVAFSLLVSGCSGEPAEKGIRRSIDLMIAAVEQGKHSQFIELVDSGFSADGPHGQLNKFQSGIFLRSQLKRYGQLTVHLVALNIEVDPIYEGQANATAELLVTGGRGLLPENGRLVSVKSRWISHITEWRLQQLDWQ